MNLEKTKNILEEILNMDVANIIGEYLRSIDDNTRDEPLKYLVENPLCIYSSNIYENPRGNFSNKSGFIYERRGDLVLNQYLKIKTINNEYPVGIEDVHIKCGGCKSIISTNFTITQEGDYYIIKSGEIYSILIPLISIQYNEIQLSLQLNINNNVENGVLIYTHVYFQNNVRRQLAQTHWDIRYLLFTGTLNNDANLNDFIKNLCN